MHRLRRRVLAAGIQWRGDADTAGEPGGLVGQDVAKEIGGGDEAVAVGIARVAGLLT